MQLHPDAKKIGQKDKETHMKFIQVTQAYEVLSKSADRKNYDQELKRSANDHLKRRHADAKGFVDLSKMTPEQRAQVWGYHVDPDFKYGQDVYPIAGLCIIVAVVGYIIHFQIAKMTAAKHTEALDKMTKESVEILESLESEAKAAHFPGFQGNHSLRNWMVKNHSAEDIKAFDEAQAKLKKKQDENKFRQIVPPSNSALRELSLQEREKL